jgi:hypothetical protein
VMICTPSQGAALQTDAPFCEECAKAKAAQNA